MIPSNVRGGLEKFFGMSMSGVRVHVASPLPALVGASAVAWNEQIWMADTQPDFSRRETMRVLVHELAHICQQRAGRHLAYLPAVPTAVGDADHRLEAEADACAVAFLHGRACPLLTADRQLALRRVLAIVPGSAKMSFDFARAKPKADIQVDSTSNTQVLVANLTAGFTDVNIISDALFWKGNAAVTSRVSNPAELKTLRFGFIQFMRQDTLTATFIGRTPSDGQIDFNPIGQRSILALDSNAAVSPFMNDIVIPVALGVAKAAAGDHPAFKLPVELTNAENGAKNFLFELTDSRKFFTVFTALEVATGKFQHLAHHTWELLYKFRLAWTGGTPRIATNSSSIKPDPVKSGAPTDGALAGLLASPKPPFANVLIGQALRNAIAPPARVDLKTRTSTTVPKDFFQ